ncbi:hypothetical protein [Candidatus Palauibacter sp.]|uniref:hypothetical protein n=1 Tax=Candidatus Palauibacter sp. TaxID=3101350 RepID=UPI003C6F21C6
MDNAVAHTGSAQLPAIAIEIGSGFELGGQDTNVRILVLGAGGDPSRWEVINAGYSDAVSDSAGSFTEIRLSLRGAVLSASVGDTTVHMENLTGAPTSLMRLTRVGLWAVPLGEAAERMALFDWVEVTGETSSASR